MTKEDRHAKLHADIDEMIDRFHMTVKCSMSRESIRRAVHRGMIQNNFAFILADVANTFLMDCQCELKKLGVAFAQ